MHCIYLSSVAICQEWLLGLSEMKWLGDRISKLHECDLNVLSIYDGKIENLIDVMSFELQTDCYDQWFIGEAIRHGLWSRIMAFWPYHQIFSAVWNTFCIREVIVIDWHGAQCKSCQKPCLNGCNLHGANYVLAYSALVQLIHSWWKLHFQPGKKFSSRWHYLTIHCLR